jgi:hypothetical protein
MGSGRPAGFPWNYDRSEIIADGVIHALGICSGLIGSVIIIVIASHSTKIVTITSVLIYAAGLVAMLGFSAAYNMWPVSPTKWVLRRFSFGHILVDRWHLHALHCATEDQLCLGRPAHGRLANGRFWCRVEASATRPFRSRSDCPLSTSRLEWCDGLRFRHCLASKLNSLASRGRRCAVFDGCHLSSLAEPAFSERDLAYLRASRRGLSLHSGPWIRGTCTGMRQLANVRFG